MGDSFINDIGGFVAIAGLLLVVGGLAAYLIATVGVTFGAATLAGVAIPAANAVIVGIFATVIGAVVASL